MYKLEKTPLQNMQHNIRAHFNKTCKSFAGFACSGVATGAMYGVIYNMNLGANKSVMIDTGGGEGVIIFGVATACFAYATYKNYKKEKSRWDEFTRQYGKQNKSTELVNDVKDTNPTADRIKSEMVLNGPFGISEPDIPMHTFKLDEGHQYILKN